MPNKRGTHEERPQQEIAGNRHASLNTSGASQTTDDNLLFCDPEKLKEWIRWCEQENSFQVWEMQDAR